MPNRILREGILTSERVAALGWPEEVFYRRLMSVVDDFGRYYANLTLIRAACYPLQLDKVSDADVGKWLRCAEKAALVSVYPASDGKRYLQLLDFKQQVRAKDSKFPSPDEQVRSTCVADAQQAHADAHLGVVVSVVEGVGDMAPPDKPALPAEQAFIGLPANDNTEVGIPESQVLEFERLYPAVAVRQQLRAMRAWLIANPAKRKTRGGMLRFVNAWLAKDQDKGGQLPLGGQSADQPRPFKMLGL